MRPPQVVQVALCSADLPRTVATLTDLGCKDAGGRVVSGPLLARVQELGHDASAVIWWLVSDAEFFQWEIFSHTVPAQRQNASNKTPFDIGWTRIGIATDDLTHALAVCRRRGAQILCESHISSVDGRLRSLLRERTTGVYWELIQRSVPLQLGPQVEFVTLSVTDIEQSLPLYREAFGFDTTDGIHTREDDAFLYGVENVDANYAVLNSWPVKVEIVSYKEPQGRCLSSDYRLSDQGFMHIAVGYRSMDALRKISEEVVGCGGRLTEPLPDGQAGGTYVVNVDGLSIELFAAPASMDAEFGFTSKRQNSFQ